MKNTILIFALSLFTAVQAQPTSKFSQAAIKMIKLSGGEHSFNIVLEEIVSNAKEFRTDISEETWKEIEIELKQLDKKELYDILIPIYERYFTIEEITEINLFLDTAAGKKFASTLPVLTTESMQAGKIWGITIAKKISHRLKEKGY